VRFLITGGAGFVGSHLADELLGRGHRVHALDDLSSGAIENIRHLRNHHGFQYTIDSCSDGRIVAELVDEVDAIFHLAAAVGVRLIVESPLKAIETNVHGTQVILAHAAKKQRPVFIASTSEVYGKSQAVPFRESADLVMGPTHLGRWSYACSKAIDEFLALAYHTERALPVIIGRLFNTVGPRQTGRYGMVLPRFIAAAKKNEPLKVFGDGAQSRCFGLVHDVVEALVRLQQNDAARGEIFNIGGTEEISILELAKLVVKTLGSKSKIELIPYDQAYAPGFDDMRRRKPLVKKLERFVKFKPQTPLREIIRLTAE